MKQLILPTIMLLSGCSSVTIDEFRHSSASLHQGESIVILGRRHANNYETEPSLINCLQVLYATAFAAWILAEVPRPETALGALLVVGATAWETRRAQRAVRG